MGVEPVAIFLLSPYLKMVLFLIAKNLVSFCLLCRILSDYIFRIWTFLGLRVIIKTMNHCILPCRRYDKWLFGKKPGRFFWFLVCLLWFLLLPLTNHPQKQTGSFAVLVQLAGKDTVEKMQKGIHRFSDEFLFCMSKMKNYWKFEKGFILIDTQ